MLRYSGKCFHQAIENSGLIWKHAYFHEWMNEGTTLILMQHLRSLEEQFSILKEEEVSRDHRPNISSMEAFVS